LKALVLGAGTPPPCELLQKHMHSASLVVCADGAADWAAARGIRPHVIVGDMDSCDAGTLRRLEEDGARVVRLQRHKDETDAQEAVDYALGAGAQEVVMLAMSGSRLDHTLANIHLLVRIGKRGAKGLLCDAHNEVRAACSPLEISAPKGTLLSILPLTDGVRVHSLKGLMYPLNGELLRPEFPRAISNVFVEETARINLEGGWAAVFLSRD
jgi:thiamine pyrophosphokinase